MSKANKGAWRSSATGIASHRSVECFVSGRCCRCCRRCVFWIFYRLWYRDTCMHAKYPDECERKTGIGVVHRLVVIASCVLHRSLCIS